MPLEHSLVHNHYISVLESDCPLLVSSLAKALDSLMASQPTVKMPKTRNFPLLSRREVEDMIAKRQQIIIVDQYVLKVDGWLQYHPGGDKTIQHMVGRDATDEVTVYVSLPFSLPRFQLNLTSVQTSCCRD